MLKFLGFFGSFSLGPVGPILYGLWKFVGTFIRWFLEGVVACVTHPATATVLLTVFVAGLLLGIRHDANEVRRVYAERQHAYTLAQERISAAEKAAAEAEQKVRDQAQPTADAQSVAAKRVRKPAAPRSGYGVFGTSSLPWPFN